MNLQIQVNALMKMTEELKAAPRNPKGKINGNRFNAIVQRCVVALWKDGETVEDARAMAKEIWKKYE